MVGKLVFLKICGIALDIPASRQAIVAGLKSLAAARPDDLIYTICGGGEPVDMLRARFESDPDGVHREWLERSGEVASPVEAAHWLAIGIMDERASMMQMECRGVENLIFPPVTRLLREREGHLPRSWEVTSDSITYWLAVALACDPAFIAIFLLKDVDGALKTQPPRPGLPRRAHVVQGKLVRRILVHGGRPHPALPSYPFDEYLFGLVDEFRQPFHIVHWQHFDRVEGILEKAAMVRCTTVMPLA
ncbi:MAG: hypothetical protein JW839_16245 [Candidatus Lokiarchaeota archaeon]|nr:hypothetical protein [Candidatus Lokiarchaeota archaeon]